MATISADFLIADKLSQYELLWGIKIRNLTNSTMCLRRDWPEYRSVSLDNCCQMWSVHLGLLELDKFRFKSIHAGYDLWEPFH